MHQLIVISKGLEAPAGTQVRVGRFRVVRSDMGLCPNRLKFDPKKKGLGG